MVLVTPLAVVFLLWLLRLLVREMRDAAKYPSNATGPYPPKDPEARLDWLEEEAEAAFKAMFEASAGPALSARYNDTKECFHDAIALAQRLGRTATAERLSQRLASIKAVFRSQFPNP